MAILMKLGLVKCPFMSFSLLIIVLGPVTFLKQAGAKAHNTISFHKQSEKEYNSPQSIILPLSSTSPLSASKSVNTTSQSALLIQRRGLAGGGDHHGPPKVNFWQDPMSPSKWKDEHDKEDSLDLAAMYSSGLAFYGGYKLFTGGKKEKKEEK